MSRAACGFANFCTAASDLLRRLFSTGLGLERARKANELSSGLVFDPVRPAPAFSLARPALAVETPAVEWERALDIAVHYFSQSNF
mmetsp:Transcript_84217/g.149214  ORF Transcript_84217/g.149214 Transcript_84217/m.149214 type:complete len:86 (-) Transcript_84217:6-263(-)